MTRCLNESLIHEEIDAMFSHVEWKIVHNFRKVFAGAGVFFFVAAPAVQVHADLPNKRIISDNEFVHRAMLDDTQLSGAGERHITENGRWEATQRKIGDVWVIDVQGEHLVGPHTGDDSNGQPLRVIVPNVRPGGDTIDAGSVFGHAGNGHIDTLTAKYQASGQRLSTMVLRFEHTRLTPYRIRIVPTLVLIVITGIFVSIGLGWFMGRRRFRRNNATQR